MLSSLSMNSEILKTIDLFISQFLMLLSDQRVPSSPAPPSTRYTESLLHANHSQQRKQ